MVINTNGYIRIARRVDVSNIIRKPPHYLAIFQWMLRQANYQNTKNLKRGQLQFTYRELREALHWYEGFRKMKYSRAACGRAMAYLMSELMVEQEHTPQGMIITICNYDTYQDAQTYKKETGEQVGEPMDGRRVEDGRTSSYMHKNAKKDKKEKESNASLEKQGTGQDTEPLRNLESC